MKTCLICSTRAPQGRSWRLVWSLVVSTMLLIGCGTKAPKIKYVASFGTVPPTEILVHRDGSTWTVCNGVERIPLENLGNESYGIPVFNGTWTGAWQGERWEGGWTDSLRRGDYVVPLVLTPLPATSPYDAEVTTSRWVSTEGWLILDHLGDSVHATISTPTGDYRYLAGTLKGNNLIVSTFDGSHLFRFEAKLRGDSLVDGEFLSGTHYRTSFAAKRHDGPLSTWKVGTQTPASDSLWFVGVDVSGDTVLWNEERLKASGKKGLVLDIMGTWCPNCMDEARLLAELKPDYPELAFVSLAFERTTGAAGLPRLTAYQKSLGLSWPVLLGGRASKAYASSVLPMVDTLKSFPTTVFWPTEGTPHVHNGFHGPATGEGYALEKAHFRQQLDFLSGRLENR